MTHIRKWVAFGIGMVLHAAPLHAKPWSYDGVQDGQDAWGTLSRDYVLCESGTRQSPVVIAYTQPGPMPHLQFHYLEGQASAAFEDYAYTISPAPGNRLVSGDTAYDLRKIRFHTPSEHLVREKFFPLEIQYIHEAADGRTLIVAILADTGSEEHDALRAVMAHLTKRAEPTRPFAFNPALLLPQSLGYYAYSGSLTLPPCTEGVEWRILKTPISVSASQWRELANAGRNARLEQPIYNRTIHETSF